MNITDKVAKLKEKYEFIQEPSDQTSTLIIKNVNSKDVGDYTLVLKNVSGVCKSTCHLDVSGKFSH